MMQVAALVNEYETQLADFLEEGSGSTLMAMECGTGFSPTSDLKSFDVRSAMTVSDVESEELDQYLAQFDDLLLQQNLDFDQTSVVSSRSSNANH